MKHISVLFLFLFANLSIAQSDSTIQVKDSVYHFPPNGVYILESVRQIRNPKLFPMDDEDCYLQIENQYAFVSFRYRGKNVIFSGTMENPLLIDYDGVLVQVFTVITDDLYNLGGRGSRQFIGVPVDYATNSEIYFLNKTKAAELYCLSHLASDEEIKKLKERASN
jgi:hypothetical protein